MSSLETEVGKQSSWRFFDERLSKLGEASVNFEFAPPEALNAFRQERLRDSLRHARSRCRFYAGADYAVVDELGGHQDVLSALAKLPIIERAQIQLRAADLRATALPDGERWDRELRTSGSTGQPLCLPSTFHHTVRSCMAFQRAYRWFSFEPAQGLADIRPGFELPATSSGKSLGKGESLNNAGWSPLRAVCQTGRYSAFLHTNTVESQLAWLEQERPSYLLSQAGNLERLALGARGEGPLDKLTDVISISQQLIPEMEKQISERLGVRVHEIYGLIEVGVVALRCDEGKNFHVLPETCEFEILDERGLAVAPGESGRLVVTNTCNAGAPLIRYDTGDWATQGAELCVCGRRLPYFHSLVGRYRRLAALPEGLWPQYSALQALIASLPEPLQDLLLQYQIYLPSSGKFELRLLTSEAPDGAELRPELRQYFNDAWRAQVAEGAQELSIQRVSSIESRGRKIDSFVSDFF